MKITDIRTMRLWGPRLHGVGGGVGGRVALLMRQDAPLIAAARTNNIPLEQMDPPVETDIITPGDSITTLITLCKKDAQPVQWLVFLQAVEPDLTNQPVKPSAPMVMYSSCGNRLEFVSSPAFVTVRTLGPLSEAGSRKPQSKSQDKSVRLALDKGFLSIGFDQAAAIILRIRKTGIKSDIGSRHFFKCGINLG